MLSASVLSALLATQAPTHQLGELTFESCTLEGPGGERYAGARCTRFSVPEDRDDPKSRTIELAVAWVPARTAEPKPDPVFFLAGGPGQAAREAFASSPEPFARILRERALILVDQRGTGASHPLDCPELAEEDDGETDRAALLARTVERTRRCRDRLSADADLTRYTTTDAVRDLDDVRRAIGAEAINLLGGSYGTRVAQVYLRNYPRHTRSVVLDGVVPPGLALGAEHAKNLDAALALQWARCAQDAECNAHFPAPAADLAQLRTELLAAPRKVKYVHPTTGLEAEDELDVNTFAGVVRLFAYSPQTASLLPMALHDAARGDSGRLLAYSSLIRDGLVESLSRGMELSVICTEDADRMKVDPEDAGTLLGTEFVTVLEASCAEWPKAERPDDFNAPLSTDVPVLILSGGLDPVTPPRYGEAALAGLGHARHVVAPGLGHGVFGTACGSRTVADFYEAPVPEQLDVACFERLQALPPFRGPLGWGP